MAASIATFLSCLLGSEHEFLHPPTNFSFLSCLLGSERAGIRAGSGHIFLSCLLGSEHAFGAAQMESVISELPTRQ